jgi:tetratricopeptide (TPR) repeat protein
MASKKSSALPSKTGENEMNNEISTKVERIVENVVLIWLDSNIKDKSNERRESIGSLQRLVNTIILLSDEIEYAELIAQIKDEKLFVIISGALGEQFAPIMEKTRQIHSIYVYCSQRAYHDKWVKDFQKVKGAFTCIKPICDALRRDIRQANNDLIPISILSSTNLNELDQSFICSLILKDVLINNEVNPQVATEFIRFCRKHYKNNSYESNIIDEYRKKDKELSPIKWYTRECFMYSMLNRALRLYDMEILTQITFFVRDLHQQINQIHAKSNEQQQQMIVYHGQGLVKDQFSSLQKSVDSLISFNTFLITTIDKEVSLNYAQQYRKDFNLIGIIFKIEIDRTRSSYPFTMLGQLDYHNDTDRHVLFSLNAIFQMKSMNKLEDGLWQVDLILAEDDNEKIKTVNKWMKTELGDLDGFFRLGKVMINMGERDKSEKLYKMLLKHTPEENAEQLAYIHRKLGHIYSEKNELNMAFDHFDKALKNLWDAVSLDHHAQQPDPSRIACCLFHIAFIFREQGKHSEISENLEKVLMTYQGNFSSTDDLLAGIYHHLSIELENSSEYNLAIKHAVEASEIAARTFKPNDNRIQTYVDHTEKLYEYLNNG